MRVLIITVLLVLSFFVVDVLADCVTQTITTMDGRSLTCTTCCYGPYTCHTTCF